MIRSIINITDISVIDQNENDNILSFQRIEFNGDEIGSGGFGSVHKVHAIDGLQSSELVLKVFSQQESKQHAYDVIKLLHEKVTKRQLKTSTPIYHDVPELLGLPFMVFKGYDNISEEHCVACLMYNLSKLGYVDYGSDSDNLEEYQGLEIQNKLYLAYQLAKTFEFLHSLEFIHADLSEDSLWFDSNRIQLAIIDYDSGYHFDSQEKPTTIGKLGYWIGNQFRNIIGQKEDSSELSTLDRLYEEYWILANALFEVVFGVMPFFFLSGSDSETRKSYSKEFEWPHIDYASPLFNTANRVQYELIISLFEQLETIGLEVLTSVFKKVFNKGFSAKTKRLSSNAWKKLFEKLNKDLDNNPLIKNFQSNKTQIKRKGEKVLFTIEAQRFNSLFVDDRLLSLNQRTLEVPLQDGKSITLRAVNDFNTVSESIEIEAFKVQPVIKEFKASTVMRDSRLPVILSWQVSNAIHVSIEGMQGSFGSIDSIEVEPTTKTTYSITATGKFDERVSEELSIDVVAPVIKFFTWEVNLNEGIDNIDLRWETENAERVAITPNVAASEPNGLTHVPISEETTFTLTAKGIFSDDEREVTAHPFPVPVVKQILAEVPKIEVNTNIDYSRVNLPKEVFSANHIQFNNEIFIDGLELQSTALNQALQFPEFTTEHELMDNEIKRRSSLSHLVKTILRRTTKQTNDEEAT